MKTLLTKSLEIIAGIIIIYLAPVLPFLIDSLNISKIMEPETASLVFGSVSPSLYVAAFFFGYLAISLWWTVQIYKGVTQSEDSPNQFSLQYYLEKNVMKIFFFLIGSSITMLIVLRVPTYFELNDTTNDVATIGLAVVTAIGWEAIARNIFKKAGK